MNVYKLTPRCTVSWPARYPPVSTPKNWVSEVCAALASRVAELGGCLDLEVKKVVLDGAIA